MSPILKSAHVSTYSRATFFSPLSGRLSFGRQKPLHHFHRIDEGFWYTRITRQTSHDSQAGEGPRSSSIPNISSKRSWSLAENYSLLNRSLALLARASCNEQGILFTISSQ